MSPIERFDKVVRRAKWSKWVGLYINLEEEESKEKIWRRMKLIGGDKKKVWEEMSG